MNLLNKPIHPPGPIYSCEWMVAKVRLGDQQQVVDGQPTSQPSGMKQGTGNAMMEPMLIRDQEVSLQRLGPPPSAIAQGAFTFGNQLPTICYLVIR